jgi:hypothetical protein
MAKKMKDFSVNVMPDEVLYTSINSSKDGYNSARMVVRKGEKEYMSISYEWEGKKIPGFAMDLMDFMKTNNMESSGVWPEKEEAFKEFSKKMNKEMCEECGEPIEKCKCKDKM